MKNLTVGNIMTRDVFALYEDDNLQMVSEMMKWRALRTLPVVDFREHLVGLVTYRDILHVTLQIVAKAKQTANGSNELPQEHYYPVSSIMHTDFIAVSEGLKISAAARLMLNCKYGRLLVVEGEHKKLVGILTEADFVKFFVEREVFETNLMSS